MANDDDAPPKDPTVKDLLAGAPLTEVVDAATRAELERWFGLPSAEALDAAGKEPPQTDLETARILETRRDAIAAVLPEFLAELEQRTEQRGSDRPMKFKPSLDVHVDPSIALFDTAMLAKVGAIADPRERERPEDIEDDLKSCAPQALLRDLHRPDTEFENKREVVDMAAEQKLDIVAEVKAAMSMSLRLPALGKSPFVECRLLLAEMKQQKAQSWPALVKSLNLTNRRVDE